MDLAQHMCLFFTVSFATKPLSLHQIEHPINQHKSKQTLAAIRDRRDDAVRDAMQERAKLRAVAAARAERHQLFAR